MSFNTMKITWNCQRDAVHALLTGLFCLGLSEPAFSADTGHPTPALFINPVNPRLVNDVSIHGLTFTVASSEADPEKGDHFHSLPTDLTPGSAEVGRLRGEELRGHSEFRLDESPRALRATLEFELLELAGRFDGINRFPFTGSIALEAYNPDRPPGAELSAFEAETVATINLWPTSDFQPQAKIRANVSDIVRDFINEGRPVLGLRLRCAPLPPSHSGAVTFHAFTLLLEPLVEFTDPNLEMAIRAALSIPDGEIAASQLNDLTSLNVPNLGIAQLSGLEFAESLSSLDLSNNLIAEISPLQHLIQLEELYLQGNLITEISALLSLESLRDTSEEGLRIDDNLLDISPGSSQRHIIKDLQLRPELTVRFRPQNLIDSDDDRLDDRFEELIITANPNDPITTLIDVLPEDDFDGDGHTNREEFRRFSDPVDPARFGLPGDLDNDQRVTVLDLIRLQAHRQGHWVSPDQEPYADTNLDGFINVTDRDAVLESILTRFPE